MSDTKSTSSREQRDVSDTPEPDSAHLGVATVKATHQVYGKYSKWFLFIGLGLAAYIYSLDGQTTYSYQALAASDLQDHSLIATVGTAQGIIIAVGKPVIAKIADVASRGTGYVAVLIFYVIGYIVVASAQNIGTVGGGLVLYAVGYTGLQLLTQIIIADITTLKWRGLVSALISLPFVVNAFIGSNVSASVINNSSWRWGYGMFAILIPAALSPLIITLLWAERKAKKLGLVPKKGAIAREKNLPRKAWAIVQEMDIIGLTLIGTSIALILLPLTLAGGRDARRTSGWDNPSMVAMIVVGFLLIPVIVLWESKYAKYPAIPRRFLVNRSIMLAAGIGFFDFISFYLTFTYLWSFAFVVKPWTTVNLNYFIQTQTIGLTVFAILGGVILRFTHRYKWLLFGGLIVRVVGVGLMIHSRGADAPDAEIVWTQILQGMGGGVASVCSQVAAQASVPHVDVATATAFVLLITEIGGSIGTAVAGAIWTNRMPGALAHYLPDLPEANRTMLYSSILTVTTFPRGHPIREGVILAYGDVMQTMLIVAVTLGAIPIALSAFMPNWYLGNTQNAVDKEDLSGNIVVEKNEAEAVEADREKV